MLANTLISVAVLASAVAAQTVFNSTSINVNEVSAQLRASWCNSQVSVCGKLCYGAATRDTCDPSTLTYMCTCSNGSTPGLQYYANTVPSYICQQAYSDCINAHPNDQAGQDVCTKSIQAMCGTIDANSAGLPSTVAAATASSTAMPSSSSTAAAVASATTSAPATTSKAGDAGHLEMSTGFLGAGLAAVIGLLI